MTDTYIPARNHGGAFNLPVIRQVVHCTVSLCVPGGALAVARMFEHTTRDASAHWVFDPTAQVRCVQDNVIAYHAPPNAHSLGYELCDMQEGSASRWNDAYHQSMMVRAAKQIAADARHYQIPIRHLTVAQLRAEDKGQCGHIDVSNAWHQTTHTDPGVGFPWTTFLNLVKQYYKSGTDLPPPTTGVDVPTQTYSQSISPQTVAPDVMTELACTTITNPSRNGVSFAEGAAYFSGYVGVSVQSEYDGDGAVEMDLHTFKLVSGAWVPASTIDVAQVGELRPGTNHFERPVQIYLPAGYRLRAGLKVPGNGTDAVPNSPVVSRGFTRLLKWSA